MIIDCCVFKQEKKSYGTFNKSIINKKATAKWRHLVSTSRNIKGLGENFMKYP